MTTQNLAAIILAAVCFAAGWITQGWRQEGEIARINETHANASRLAAEKNATELAAARQRGDQLTLQLAGYENTLQVFAQEKNREIARLTTGRRCLDGAAVRVLNQSAGSLGQGIVPASAGSALRPAANATAGADDGAFATDADVAGWIGLCQRSYDTCRSRLDAIARFYNEVSE